MSSDVHLADRPPPVCRRAAVGLEPTPQASAAARSFVAGTLRRWGIDSSVDEASLAVSELVTNAVLHARTPVEVSLSVIDGLVELGVGDSDPRGPVLRPVRLDLLADLDAIPLGSPVVTADDRTESPPVGRSGSVYGGRGLLIVDALADEWGVSERRDGKEVWLTLPVSWVPGSPCPCRAADERSASGRTYAHVSGPWDLER